MQMHMKVGIIWVSRTSYLLLKNLSLVTKEEELQQLNTSHFFYLRINKSNSTLLMPSKGFNPDSLSPSPPRLTRPLLIQAAGDVPRPNVQSQLK
ncbi:hypothetical protein AQUCO_06900029v1 [Aquilegia coerulea]|uniref:Uncharacterized protein n=1 Tax=Aquilegia coerulea TaxID=218851 RepID=A0A2G5CB31_AQUCA|nr:hypothetical protein AQUCO_06900029v1 [Aquilegia coerulea]